MSTVFAVHALCGVIVAAAFSAPADDVHRQAASITGLQQESLHPKAPPAHTHADGAEVSEKSTAEDSVLSLADISALGLQRSMTIRKRPKALSSEMLERAGAAKVLKNVAVTPTQGGAVAGASELILADVSVLGLQRPVTVQKRPKVVSSEEFQSAGTSWVSKNVVAPLIEGSAVEDVGELSLADVSALGLQRSMTVRKRPKAVSSTELERAGSAEVSKDVALPLTKRSAAADAREPSFADVSVLGLQRSTIIQKRPEAVSSEELERAGTAWVSNNMSLLLTDGSAAEDVGELSLADVSLLGLQRSTIVRKRPEANNDISWPLEEEVAEAALGGLSLADVSLLGLQRSAKIVRRHRVTALPSIAGGQRSASEGSLSGSASELVPGGFMRKAPRVVAVKLV